MCTYARTRGESRPTTAPIYLLADSQLLFWRTASGSSSFLESVRRGVAVPSPRAAYIGASNGDLPEFYDLFAAALDRIGITDRRMIASVFSPADKAFLASADIILLAGGDAARGWRVILDTGMHDLIVRRHDEGARLIGVSAGAMQLGAFGVIEHDGALPELFSTLGLCPFVVSSHDERRDWQSLASAVSMLKGAAKGLAIPTGGGVVYHGDGGIEALRLEAYELIWMNGAVRRRRVPISR